MMNIPEFLVLSVGLLVSLSVSLSAQDAADSQTKGKKTQTDPKAFLKSLVGSWEGSCRTWFKPGELADESQIKGEFRLFLNGKFLRHTYDGQIQGKPRSGEETIVFNSAKNKFQTSWMDDFHMNYGILFSEGEPSGTGFSVYGTYNVAPTEPPWGWKTVYELKDSDHLTLTSYNVLPDGTEAKAVETKYIRQKR